MNKSKIYCLIEIIFFKRRLMMIDYLNQLIKIAFTLLVMIACNPGGGGFYDDDGYTGYDDDGYTEYDDDGYTGYDYSVENDEYIDDFWNDQEDMWGGGETPVDASEWTVFVYAHADHNLSNSMWTDIAEMQAATLSNDVNLIVAVDYNASLTNYFTNQLFPEGTLIFKIACSNQDHQLLDYLPEENFDDPSVLQEKIEYVYQTFPARRYGLILWDHGGAWYGGYGGDRQNGTDQYPKGISNREVASSIQAALQNQNISKLDFFSFDTCLMGGVELIYEFMDITKYYIANAEIDYGDGWDYKKTFSYLSANPMVTTEQFVLQENIFWGAHHQESFLDQNFSSHISIDMSNLTDFKTVFKNLTIQLRSLNDQIYQSVAQTIFSYVSPVYEIDNAKSFNRSVLRDLGQFLQNLQDIYLSRTDTNIPEIDETLNALNSMTVRLHQGKLRAQSNQNGLHIYLPLANDFETTSVNYTNLAYHLYQESDWYETLKDFSESSPSTAPTIRLSADEDQNGDGFVEVKVSTNSPNQVYVEYNLYEAQNDGSRVLNGYIASGYLENANRQISYDWSGVSYVLNRPGERLPISLKFVGNLGIDEAGQQVDLFEVYGAFSYSEDVFIYGSLYFLRRGGPNGVLDEMPRYCGEQNLDLNQITIQECNFVQNTYFTAFREVIIQNQIGYENAGEILFDDQLVLQPQTGNDGTYIFKITAQDIYGNQSAAEISLNLSSN